MHITILAIGMRMPSWINQGVSEYQKRFPPELKVKLTEVAAGKRAKSSSEEKVLKLEADRISAAIPKGSHVIALDEHGKKKATKAVARHMETSMKEGSSLVFIIGGADGLHEELKARADEIWSLSDLTLPHGLARVVLMEQLYRAWSVIKRHPYHRE